MGGKKIKGRKRHIVVDSQGSLIKVNITAGNISDKQGFCQLLKNKEQSFPSIKKVWADHGYQGESLKKIAFEHGIDLEIVKRPPGRYRIYNENWQAEWTIIEREFSVLPRRWVVERFIHTNARQKRVYRSLFCLSAKVFFK